MRQRRARDLLDGRGGGERASARPVPAFVAEQTEVTGQAGANSVNSSSKGRLKMKKRARRMPSPSVLVALLALFLRWRRDGAGAEG